MAYLSRFETRSVAGQEVRVRQILKVTKRRRPRTINHELVYVPARILTGSNQLKLDLGRNLFGRAAYLELWASLARAA